MRKSIITILTQMSSRLYYVRYTRSRTYRLLTFLPDGDGGCVVSEVRRTRTVSRGRSGRPL